MPQPGYVCTQQFGADQLGCIGHKVCLVLVYAAWALLST